MTRSLFSLVVLGTTAACAHRHAPDVATEDAAKARCSRAAIDSLPLARQDSARIDCAGYRYQTIRIERPSQPPR